MVISRSKGPFELYNKFMLKLHMVGDLAVIERSCYFFNYFLKTYIEQNKILEILVTESDMLPLKWSFFTNQEVQNLINPPLIIFTLTSK